MFGLPCPSCENSPLPLFLLRPTLAMGQQPFCHCQLLPKTLTAQPPSFLRIGQGSQLRRGVPSLLLALQVQPPAAHHAFKQKLICAEFSS